MCGKDISWVASVGSFICFMRSLVVQEIRDVVTEQAEQFLSWSPLVLMPCASEEGTEEPHS